MAIIAKNRYADSHFAPLCPPTGIAKVGRSSYHGLSRLDIYRIAYSEERCGAKGLRPRVARESELHEYQPAPPPTPRSAYGRRAGRPVNTLSPTRRACNLKPPSAIVAPCLNDAPRCLGPGNDAIRFVQYAHRLGSWTPVRLPHEDGQAFNTPGDGCRGGTGSLPPALGAAPARGRPGVQHARRWMQVPVRCRRPLGLGAKPPRLGFGDGLDQNAARVPAQPHVVHSWPSE